MARTPKSHEQSKGAEEPNDIVKIVAQKLQEARIRAGLTQVQLGEKAGLKQSYIFELEYGNTNITLRTLEKMATALDVDVRDLLPGSALAPPSAADIQNILQHLDQLVNAAEAQLKTFTELQSSVKAFGTWVELNAQAEKDS